MLLITGGAGFIGSAFVLQWIEQKKGLIVNLDKLTYAGNALNLERLKSNSLYTFVKGDIGDRQLVRQLLQVHQPQYIVHCAAESHVDRSITFPEPFITTNILGTFVLLEECLHYWNQLPPEKQLSFRFLYLSTDEVFGSLDPTDLPITEDHAYAANSPYSASKASAECLVRAYNRTFNLPTLTTHSTNNFGPRQYPEKLIPLSLFQALANKPIPIYGNGLNVRDWIYVDTHCDALRCVLEKGTPGQSYNISASNEKTNLEVIEMVCQLLDELKPRIGFHYSELIEFVKDRPGHDKRYALDNKKIQTELGWYPKSDFKEELRKTIVWYLENPEWISFTQDRLSEKFYL